MAKQSDTVGIPKRLPLVAMLANRDTSPDKDSRMVNCYGEKTPEGGYRVYKRPGLLEIASLSETGTGRGMYNWRGDVYTVFGAAVFKNGTSLGAVTDSGIYHFNECLGGTPRLFFGNGTTAYTYDGTTLAAVSDGDFPSSFVPGSAYLDATTYVMTPAAVIQGSDLDDPTAWEPLNFLTAQIEPDQGVAISKQLVYVVAFKQWTTEIFYDAENATGSPLGRVQGAKVSYGCANGESVQRIDDTLVWLSTTRELQPQVVLMTNLKAEVISTPPVERLLSGVVFTTVYSWSLKIDGHAFYVLTSVQANITLVYDIREQLWWRWTDADGNYVPIVAASFNSSNQHLLQHVSNGKVYIASSEYFNDDGSVITVDLYTPNWDGGVDRRKMATIMRFLGDKETGSILQVRHNDKDYDPAAWTRFRPVDMGLERPILTDLGTFNRRAHHIRHQSNTRMRLEAVDVQLDIGTL